MTSEIRCPNCGIRLRAASGRCPRCRFKLGSVAPALAEAKKASRERAFGRIALSLTAVLAVVLVMIWWQRRPAPVAPVKAQRPRARRRRRNRACERSCHGATGRKPRQLVVPRELQMNASDAYAPRTRCGRSSAEPDDAGGAERHGNGVDGAGDSTTAIPYLERAMRSDATRWQAPFNLGRVRAQLRDWPAAIRCFGRRAPFNHRSLRFVRSRARPAPKRPGRSRDRPVSTGAGAGHVESRRAAIARNQP